MTDTPTVAAQPVRVRPPQRKGNPWLPTFSGVALVTRIELLRRRPSAKGYIVFGLMVAGIIALAVLAAVRSGDGLNSTLMELVLVLVLGVGLLVAPSLSATSLNGDSSEGVLAPLQMTHLTAGDLAVGKLLASWLFSVAILITTTPLLWFAFTRSGWHGGELAIVLAVILFTVLVFTAVGLAWSAIAARAVASVSLAHLTTGFLALGTLLVFAFTLPLVSEEVPTSQSYIDWGTLDADQQEAIDAYYSSGTPVDLEAEGITCTTDNYTASVAHTERTAWMLLINPVVVIGEASPIVNPETYQADGRAEPGLFAQMHQMVGDARLGPDLAGYNYDECAEISGTGTDLWEERQEAAAIYPRQPWVGLGAQALILVGAMTIVVRRLRVPYKNLRTGTRVA